MASVLVTNATIVPVAPDGPAVVHDAWMLVGDGIITDIGTGRAPTVSCETIDAGGSFVAPGFVSSHSHLATSGSRGLAADQSLYEWCTAMYGITRKAQPEDIYWCTLHGSLDALGNGVTTAFDFTEGRLPWEPMIEGHRQPSQTLRPLDFTLRQIDAKLDSGLRFVNGLPLDDAVGDTIDVLARFDRAHEYLLARDPRYALGSAVAGAVQWSETTRTAEIEVEVMRKFGVMNQAHFLETSKFVEIQQQKFDWYEQAGALGPNLIFGHFVQTTPDIIARAAAAGCGMSWQPTANGRLGSGIAPIDEIRRSGMRIGLGLDDQACTDIADPWQNMRMGLYMVRADHRDPGALGVADVLRFHTLDAAKVLGVSDRVGSLEVGKYADFVIVDPRKPDVGPLWDPLASYVLSCGLRNLKSVYVGGRLESIEGRSVRPIADRARTELHRTLRELNPERAETEPFHAPSEIA